MKYILVIGAGRSAVSLIDYLLEKSDDNDWHITVADFSLELAMNTVANHKNGKAIFLDIEDLKQRELAIAGSDIVISMLPANLHITVAKDCVRFKKNLVTASYVSNEIAELDEPARRAGVLLLNEIGLDPGIDHMSAMKVIDEIKENKGLLTSFKSFCGGLIHPEFDNNPWNYKFTWNPRNVVLAGQGAAQYIKQGKYKYIPYSKLFERTEKVEVLSGEFEGYANRDSLAYRSAYSLGEIPTLFRGTLRKKGYCKAWNMFVQLGMTDDTYKVKNSENLTYREYINLFFPYNNELSVEEKFCSYLKLDKDSEEFKKVEWLGVFTDTCVELKDASPAQILQKICEEKWTLDSEDKDMIVMQHQFEYMQNGKKKKLNSSLLVYGETPRFTAMAKTVGFPVAIATKLILSGAIKSSGVRIPTTKDIYTPVLKELSENGINFIDELV
jgi:saccharopine dehydrogenase-like NADP-dependent oxidoreductase